MKRLAVLASMAAVIWGIAACTSETPGNPNSTNAAGQSSDSQPANPSSSTGNSALLVDHPCSLLSSSDLEQLGASTPPSEDQTGNTKTCEIVSSNGGLTLGVQKVGLSQLVITGTVTDMPIGNHQAKKMSDNSTGDCLVAIGLTSSSRVDIVGSATTSSGDPCPIAVKAAELVEPHLPPQAG